MTEIDPALRDLLQSFKLWNHQKAAVWDAYLESAEGLEEIALRAKVVGRRNGNTGAGLLLKMIEAGEHLLRPDTKARRITGHRFVRGSHSGSYVRDKFGTDPLPEGFEG